MRSLQLRVMVGTIPVTDLYRTCKHVRIKIALLQVVRPQSASHTRWTIQLHWHADPIAELEIKTETLVISLWSLQVLQSVFCASATRAAAGISGTPKPHSHPAQSPTTKILAANGSPALVQCVLFVACLFDSRRNRNNKHAKRRTQHDES